MNELLDKFAQFAGFMAPVLFALIIAEIIIVRYLARRHSERLVKEIERFSYAAGKFTIYGKISKEQGKPTRPRNSFDSILLFFIRAAEYFSMSKMA